jgi:IS30 family transposase
VGRKNEYSGEGWRLARKNGGGQACPPDVQTRQQFGHWEADLMMFSNRKDNLLVLQERSSRFVMLTLQPDKKSQRVIDNQLQYFMILPKQARRSLTQDNGTEFSLHHKLQQIGMQTYFCNPHSPWQKGGIENMNGHLRRYLPLRTDISTLSNEQVALLAHRINHIPRKCLDYKTPAEVFYNHLLHFKCESTSPPCAGVTTFFVAPLSLSLRCHPSPALAASQVSSSEQAEIQPCCRLL